MHGCNQRCSVLSDISQESKFVFVVARTDVIMIKVFNLFK